MFGGYNNTKPIMTTWNHNYVNQSLLAHENLKLDIVVRVRCGSSECFFERYVRTQRLQNRVRIRVQVTIYSNLYENMGPDSQSTISGQTACSGLGTRLCKAVGMKSEGDL